MGVLDSLLKRARPATAWALSLVDQYPTRQTDKSEVEALLRTLYPVATETPLIRLGPSGDGGYLVPDDLLGIEACFSPGVDRISGFEKDCADRGMQVFMADRSVERPAEMHDAFHFVRKHVGATSDDDTMTMDRWVEASLPESKNDLLLQIDIEGSEYEVFLNASDELMQRFRVIVAECHALDMLFSGPFFGIASRAFDKILKTHVCVHIHPNNCCGSVKVRGVEIPRLAEFTFIRSDRLRGRTFVESFPHPLDFDNTDQPHMVLPRSLYSSPHR